MKESKLDVLLLSITAIARSIRYLESLNWDGVMKRGSQKSKVHSSLANDNYINCISQFLKSCII